MKNLKKKTKMKSNIFGVEYTAEEKERMAQVILSATQFMKNYGKGMPPSDFFFYLSRNNFCTFKFSSSYNDISSSS